MNEERVKDMIGKLYLNSSERQSYGQRMLESFLHCSHPSAYNVHKLPMSVLHIMSAHKYNPLGLNDCDSIAMRYAKCAIAHTYLNCPKELRPVEDEETGDCSASKRLMNHCVNVMFRQPVVNEDSLNKLKRFMRSAAVSYKLTPSRVRPTTHWYTAFANWFVF